MARNKSRRPAPQRQTAPPEDHSAYLDPQDPTAEWVLETPESIARFRERNAATQPRWYASAGETAWAAGVRLQDAAAAVRDLEATQAREVARLRDLGASWAVVGWLVGMTGEGARKRWGSAGAGSLD